MARDKDAREVREITVIDDRRDHHRSRITPSATPAKNLEWRPTAARMGRHRWATVAPTWRPSGSRCEPAKRTDSAKTTAETLARTFMTALSLLLLSSEGDTMEPMSCRVAADAEETSLLVTIVWKEDEDANNEDVASSVAAPPRTAHCCGLAVVVGCCDCCSCAFRAATRWVRKARGAVKSFSGGDRSW